MLDLKGKHAQLSAFSLQQSALSLQPVFVGCLLIAVR
jgi:hypothetical protein